MTFLLVKANLQKRSLVFLSIETRRGDLFVLSRSIRWYIVRAIADTIVRFQEPDSRQRGSFRAEGPKRDVTREIVASLVCIHGQ